MKKIYIFSLIVALCILLFILIPRVTNAPTQNGKITEPVLNTTSSIAGDVTLGAGEKGQVGDLSISWNGPVQDSRCPTGAQCIWAGDLKVNVTMALTGYTETTNLSTTNAGYLFDGHTVSIASVTPSPIKSQIIAPQDYRITFHVETH